MQQAGTDGEGYCGALYTGPECRLCKGSGSLFRKGVKCLECPDALGRLGVLIGLTAGVAALLAAFSLALFHPAGARYAPIAAPRRHCFWVWSYATSIGAKSKLKILFSFYGIISALDTVYDARLPAVYTDVVAAAFGWARPEQWFADLILPAECTPFGKPGSRFR